MLINSGIRPNHLASYHNGFNHAQTVRCAHPWITITAYFAKQITDSEMVKLTVAQAEKMIPKPTYIGKGTKIR